MRYPNPRRRQRRSKTVIMTGGLNEIVTSLELKEGELHQCINYMEIDSPYHGYASVQGYERYDGKLPPSAVEAPLLTDEGLDNNVTLLLEAPTGVVDLSDSGNTIDNYGIGINEEITKFFGGSFDLPGMTYFVLTPAAGGEFDQSFDESFNKLQTGPSPVLTGDWTMDIQLRRKLVVNAGTIFEKKGSYKLTMDGNGFVTFATSSDGVTYDTQFVQQSQPFNSSVFQHLSVTSRDQVLRMAIDGNILRDGNGDILEVPGAGIFSSGTQIYFGCDADVSDFWLGYIDEVRFSNISRWYDDFNEPIVRYTDVTYKELNWFDEDREDQRDTITPVPGVGPILGVHIYQGEVYALRNADNSPDDPIAAALYRANRVYDVDGNIDDTLSGWELIDDTFAPNGRLDAVNWRFSGSFEDKQVMIMVDGVSIPRIYDKNTETMYLYDNPESVDIPDRHPTTPRYAKRVSIFDNRALLAYAEDDILLSSKFDPRDFALGFGDQLLIGDEITNLMEIPGESMAIFCRNSVKVLQKLQGSTGGGTDPDYSFKVEHFSRQAGAISWSVEQVLGKILYADDRGIVDFQAVDKFGDFDASAISKKVNRIFLDKKDAITTSLVDKEINQYRLFFSDATSLWFTFLGEELKGATFVAYLHPVLVATEGEDLNGDIMKFFGSDDGYVYEMDSGTSFDGEVIDTEMFTAYYHYASPRHWKQFIRMIFEITADRGTEFAVRPVFDYDSSDFPETKWWNPLLKGFSGRWGIDDWGNFVWGGAEIQRAIHYVRGVGTNMSIEMRTSSKYVRQHIVHNAIVDFEQYDLQE